MKKQWMMAVMVLGLFVLFGCDQDESDKSLHAQQESLMQEANREAGMPAITNFQERKLLKKIYELRDQSNLICYAYIVAEMSGKLVFIGKCLGFGVPYSTEYTNPMKLVGQDPDEHATSLPQADPNGLFSPSSAAGTWIMLLDSTGDPHPVYMEPNVIVSPFPLETK